MRKGLDAGVRGRSSHPRHLRHPLCSAASEGPTNIMHKPLLRCNSLSGKELAQGAAPAAATWSPSACVWRIVE